MKRSTMHKIILNVIGIFWLSCLHIASGFCGTEPSGIKVTGHSSKSVHVVWDTTKTNCGYTISGYRIYFESTSPLQTYKHKDVSGATTDNVEIFPIIPSFTYKIYVKALTSSGNEVSNPTDITYTHPHAKPGTAPSNIHASLATPTNLTIEWDPLSIYTKNGDVRGYDVFYRGPGLPKTQHVFLNGETNRKLEVTGLQPNSTYQFILRVVNDVGTGPYSSFININTLPLPTTTTSTTTPLPSTSTSTTTTTTRTSLSSTLHTTLVSTSGLVTSGSTTQKVPSSSASMTSPSANAKTSKIFTLSTKTTSVLTSSLKSTKEPEKETNNILLIVGITAGCLILLAALIPLIVYMCRNCCLKSTVSPNQKSEMVTDQIPTKEAFTQVDEDLNKTLIINDRRMSTDTLLSIDDSDEGQINETKKSSSRHRRFSKRALSYTDDSLEEDTKQIQNSLTVNKSPPMRVESIVEMHEPESEELSDINAKSVSFYSANSRSEDIGDDRSRDETKTRQSSHGETNNVYVPYLDIQTKMFPPKKSKGNHERQSVFSREETMISDHNTQSVTSFSIISKPAQTNPRVTILESF